MNHTPLTLDPDPGPTGPGPGAGLVCDETRGQEEIRKIEVKDRIQLEMDLLDQQPDKKTLSFVSYFI